MSIKLNDNFLLKSNKPLDGRLAFTTYEEMISYPKKSLYEGLKSYCKETGCYYSLLSVNSDELEWVKDINKSTERNISIQVPKSTEGIVYPEVLVESLLFDGEKSLCVTSIKVISRKLLSQDVEFKLVSKSFDSETTVDIVEDILEAGINYKEISEIQLQEINSGYLYIEFTNCNGISEPLDFVISLKAK